MLPHPRPSQFKKGVHLIPPDEEISSPHHDVLVLSPKGRRDLSASGSFATNYYGGTIQVEQSLELHRKTHHISSDVAFECVAGNEMNKGHCGELRNAKSAERTRMERRRAANRRFAAESRRRKKELLLRLRSRAALLSEENLKLENENEELRKQLRLEMHAASIRQKRGELLNLLKRAGGGVTATRFHRMLTMIHGLPVSHGPNAAANNVAVPIGDSPQESNVVIVTTSFVPRETLHASPPMISRSHSALLRSRSFSRVP